MTTSARTVDVAVIGAGQAGLSAAYHLLRRGFRPASAPRPDHGDRDGTPTFTVIDAENAPGGAWRHRWDSLTMATVNGIRELPGMEPVRSAPQEPARVAVPEYFADFEARFSIPVERPVRVTRIEDTADADRAGASAAPAPLIIRSVGPDGAERAPLLARAVLNATGTWTRPFRPSYPGAADFHGRQVHTVDYTGAAEFSGQRVGIVGGGISALGFLLEIAEVATTRWYTRREPVFTKEPFTPEVGSRVVAGVAERVSQGLPVGSVVSHTDLPWTPQLRRAADRGILARRPMFTRLTPDGVIEADGSLTRLDAMIWATGFRHELRHLRSLGLRNAHGGIRIDGTAVAADPRIHLLGYGPSASTIGANRAGRAAVNRLLRDLYPAFNTSRVDGIDAVPASATRSDSQQ